MNGFACRPLSPKIFRLILLVSFGSGLISGSIDSVFSSLIPETLSSALAANEAETSMTQIWLIVCLAFPLLVMWLAACYGLYMFRPWAPHLAIVVSLLAVVSFPVLGVSVSSGWASAFAEISNVTWGAVLALSFFSSLSEEFGAKLKP